MHHLPSRFLLGATYALVCLSGCSGGASPEASAPTPAEAPAPKAEAAPETAKAAPPSAAAVAPSGPAPSTIEDPAFSLRLVAAGPYKTGELARFVLELEPKGVYHVNQEYPVEISLSGPVEVALAKAHLERPDAAEFTLKKARFDIPFTAKAAGALSVNANVKFAVCTDENCVPDERNLALALAVQ